MSAGRHAVANDGEARSMCKRSDYQPLVLPSRLLCLACACALLVCRSGDQSDRAFDEAVGALEEMLIGKSLRSLQRMHEEQ